MAGSFKVRARFLLWFYLRRRRSLLLENKLSLGVAGGVEGVGGVDSY